MFDYFLRVFAEHEHGGVGNVHPEAWTLKYLGNAYKGPLVELLDSDSSGFVNVQEVNQFTQEMPEGCRYSAKFIATIKETTNRLHFLSRSLPLWLVYCTIGWMLETAQYVETIISLEL